MKKLWFQIIVIISTIAALSAGTALAQVQMDPNLKPDFAPSYTSSQNRATPVTATLQLVAGSLIYVAGPLAVLMIAAGGFMYVTSHGDSTQMENAKKTIMFAIIGLVVIIVSWAIVTNIAQVFLTTGVVGTG